MKSRVAKEGGKALQEMLGRTYRVALCGWGARERSKEAGGLEQACMGRGQRLQESLLNKKERTR